MFHHITSSVSLSFSLCFNRSLHLSIYLSLYLSLCFPPFLLTMLTNLSNTMLLLAFSLPTYHYHSSFLLCISCFLYLYHCITVSVSFSSLSLTFFHRVSPCPSLFLHSNNPAHRYYLATDPVTGQLYVSDTNSRRIYRPRALGGSVEPQQNVEVVVGTGEHCLPFDEAHCGDGGPATDASLAGPKGRIT